MELSYILKSWGGEPAKSLEGKDTKAEEKITETKGRTEIAGIKGKKGAGNSNRAYLIV